VGDVKGVDGRGGEGRSGLGLDGGEDELGVLVGVVLGGGEDRGEEGEEVGSETLTIWSRFYNTKASR
jgi:hypothetical protein